MTDYQIFFNWKQYIKPRLIFSRILFLMIISSCKGCDDKQVPSVPRFNEEKDNVKNLSISKKNKNSIQKQIIEQPGLYMLLLYVNKCIYCKLFIPKFKKLSDEYKEDYITFGGILFSDNDNERSQQKQLINKLYGIEIKTFPCIIIVKDGDFKEIIQGKKEERKKDNLVSLIESYIN